MKSGMKIKAAALTAALLVLPGCGVELAVLGAAASAASAGSAVYSRGKLHASWMAPFDLVVAAGESSFSELGMLITDSSGNAREGQWTIKAITGTDDEVEIRVQRETRDMTEFVIDVGWFGQEPTARLVLKRMAVAINLAYEEAGVYE